jgi:hypothetical protein
MFSVQSPKNDGIEETVVFQGNHRIGMKNKDGIGRDGFPSMVRYDDIRQSIPRGHVLVGIGRDGKIETREEAVGACVWIVGLSRTGKTSTVVLRIEERFAKRHKFLGIDPHAFKPDSLTNAVQPYASAFLMPMARDTESALEV